MKIIHLSDMHFGTETENVVRALTEAVNAISSDLIVISGDFTQRALHKQYIAVQQFLSQFDKNKLICVPGNHDISLHKLWERFAYPFAIYKNYISENLNPQYQDNLIALLGINSVTPYRIKDGYITEEQLHAIKTFFATVPPNRVRIALMHHNLIKSNKHRIILNSESLFHTLAESKVNIVLSGHLHFACVEPMQNEFINYPLYIVTAGTATSRRMRAQQNSFNVIEIEEGGFTLEVHEYNGREFVTAMTTAFKF